MKIIAVDNFARETEADILVATGIVSEDYGQVMRDALQDKYGGNDAPQYYRLVEDAYVLSRGLADMI